MSAAARAWVVLLATLVGVATTARLGFWQLDRAAQKQSLQASLDSRQRLPPLQVAELASTAAELPAQIDRRIRLRGRWVASATVYLDNRQMDGRPGFYVVTPLRLDGASDALDAVLVQRGWLPRDATDRTRIAAYATPDGPVEIDGRVARLPPRLHELGADEAAGAIRQNLDLGALSRQSGLRPRPLSVVQLDSADGAAPADGLLRRWPAPAADVHKHYGYAAQWFALCALMTGSYVWFRLVRPLLRKR